MAQDKRDLPPVSPALMEWLTEAFPDTIPEGEVTERELGKLQGQQDIVRRLHDIYRQQDGPDVFHRRTGRSSG